jgi:pyruvate-formate lyase-activating enzyme
VVPGDHLTPLAIFYVSPLRRCNFKCSYCVSHQPSITDTLEWHRTEDKAQHQQVVEWICRLPHRVRLRLGSAGEPFVSAAYLNSVVRLTHSANLEFVEVLTNGSWGTAQFEKFISECDVRKLTLWMTYHHSEITLERFVAAAVQARSSGATVIVHALLFPDNLKAANALKEMCSKHGLTLHVGLGLNINNAYPEGSRVPVLDQEDADPTLLSLNVAFPAEVYDLVASPRGALCSAGHNYIYINRRAEVHQCNTYAKYYPSLMLGSAANPDFVLNLRTDTYYACGTPERCVCVEDYQHLQLVQEKQRIVRPSLIASSLEEIG